jgi:hypothetical protein
VNTKRQSFSLKRLLSIPSTAAMYALAHSGSASVNRVSSFEVAGCLFVGWEVEICPFGVKTTSQPD